MKPESILLSLPILDENGQLTPEIEAHDIFLRSIGGYPSPQPTTSTGPSRPRKSTSRGNSSTGPRPTRPWSVHSLPCASCERTWGA